MIDSFPGHARRESAVTLKAASTQPDEERDLVSRLRAGEEEAFEEVVRLYAGRLLAVARRFLTREEDAGDAVQDAFLSAFKALDQFTADARLSTWLHRIVVNAALMKLRARKRRPEGSIEELLPRFHEDGIIAEMPREWPAPADVLLQREETRQTVRRSIDKLPDGYREVLLLRDIEELNTEETARLLGITAGAVKVRLHRARLALRTLLSAEFSMGTS
jgi:RNA polymerase sigma-70 factor (ECF subfamily)